jgi:hypothetical protein
VDVWCLCVCVCVCVCVCARARARAPCSVFVYRQRPCDELTTSPRSPAGCPVKLK